MNPEEIYQALHRKNLNIAMLAESLDVSTQAVSKVIKQGKNSRRIAKAISLAIDRPLEKVFPHYAQAEKQRVVRNQRIDQLKQQFAHL